MNEVRERVIIMLLHLLYKGAIIGALLAGVTIMTGASSKKLIESVKTMERELGLTVTWHSDLVTTVRRTQQITNKYNLVVSSTSPDGTAIAWSSYPNSGPGQSLPFLTVRSLKKGVQPVPLEGRIAVGSSVSTGAEVIVALAIPLDPIQKHRWELLAIERRSGIVVHDLTPFVTQFELGNNIGDIRVSGPGTLVAIGTHDTEQIQVLEIPSGNTVYSGHGICPRLSPDGTRLAFVHKGAIWIHSFVDGSTAQLFKGPRVKGVGGWSPNGRFLIAGAWTTPLAFEKRQIIVDTSTGEYAAIGKLTEGDYGCAYEWVSNKLLERYSEKL